MEFILNIVDSISVSFSNHISNAIFPRQTSMYYAYEKYHINIEYVFQTNNDKVQVDACLYSAIDNSSGYCRNACLGDVVIKTNVQINPCETGSVLSLLVLLLMTNNQIISYVYVLCSYSVAVFI